MSHKIPYHLQFDLPARRAPAPPPPPKRNNIFSDWGLADEAVPVVNTRTSAAASFFSTRTASIFVAPTEPRQAVQQDAAVPSEEQRVVMDLLRGRAHNLVVNSIAGAGKTTTIVFAVQQMLADLAPDQAPPTVHLITYNASLKLETRERLAALGLAECTHAHSYHSHAVHHLAPTCFDDQSLAAALRRKRDTGAAQISRLPAAGLHLLFLDEVQDQTELYYRYLCSLLRDLAAKAASSSSSSSSAAAHYPVMCLLGDSRQCIFQFNGADERFLELAPQLLAFTGRPWAAPTLTTSYRLTSPVAAFVNHVMLQIPVEGADLATEEEKERARPVLRAAMGIGIRSDRQQIRLPRTGKWVPAPKPRYLVCNAFGEEVYRELRYYLDMGYGPGDVFVVAPSVASAQSPIRRLENTLKQRMPHLQLFVTSGKEERLDKDVLEGKLVFATMHQTKGLGRPVVIVLCFDDSYFRFMARDLDPLRCANVLYVAATRSSAHLSLVQHNKNGPLPFLNAALLPVLATVRHLGARCAPPPPPSAARADGSSSVVAVSKLTEHIPPHVLETVRQSLRVTVVREMGTVSEVLGKTQQDKGVENVSAITGTAIPAYFELQRTGHMTIFRNLVDAKFEAKVAQMEHTTSCSTAASSSSSFSPSNSFGGSVFGKEDDDDDDEERSAPTGSPEQKEQEEQELLADWEKPFHLSSICLARLSPAELLYIANCHNANESQFTHKVFQIKNYDWLSPGVLADCVARLDSLEIPASARFERLLPEVRNRVEMCGRSLVGSVDCIAESSSSSPATTTAGCIFEFKCVSALTTEHLIQLALYMYMHNCARGTTITLWGGGRRATPIRGQLFNVLTGELWELVNDPAALEEMVRLLCETKYGRKHRTTDAQFLATAMRVRAEVGIEELLATTGEDDQSSNWRDDDGDSCDDGEEEEAGQLPKRRRRSASSTVVLDAPGDLESPRRRSARLAHAAQKLMHASSAPF